MAITIATGRIINQNKYMIQRKTDTNIAIKIRLKINQMNSRNVMFFIGY